MNNLYPLSKESFNKLIPIKFNNINDGFNNFSNGILECSDSLLSFKDKEAKFLNFFKDILILNSNNIIVDFYLKDLNGDELLNLLNSLDHNNKIILLQELKNLKDDSIYFELDNSTLMDFITILNTRELFFCTIYLNKFPFTIWGNYNLKFPVFFFDIKTLDIYKYLAQKNGLLINSITIKRKV